MIRIKKILFPTDFSRCSNQALAHAVYLAGKYDAVLHVLHAVVLYREDVHLFSQDSAGMDELYREQKSFSDEQMNNQVKRQHPVEENLVFDVKRGFSASEVILDYIQDQNIDLVVMGTNGRKGWQRFFLGSVAAEVVRLSSCPVLTLRENGKRGLIAERDRILVPLDFSEHSEEALSLGKALMERYGAELHLLHVVEETVPPAFYGMGMTDILEMRPNILERSKETLEQLAKEIPGSNDSVRYHAVTGHAAKEIIRFAERNAMDMIVIVTHGHTGLKRLFIGSVAETVVHMASCPVLTVRHAAQSLLV